MMQALRFSSLIQKGSTGRDETNHFKIPLIVQRQNRYKMGAREQLEIKIQGKRNDEPLTPATYDIRELKELLEHVDLLMDRKGDKESLVSLEMREGSVVSSFMAPRSKVVTLQDVFDQLSEGFSISGMPDSVVKVLKFLQTKAKQKDWSFGLTTSLDEGSELVIDRNTRFEEDIDVWVDSEFHLYGKITNAGGKNTSNVHLETEEYGLLTITMDMSMLADFEGNMLYKHFGIRASGKENIQTGAMDKQSLRGLEIIYYDPTYNEEAMSERIKRSTPHWADVDDSIEWLRNLRGYDEP